MSCEIYEGENLVLDDFISNNGMTYSHNLKINNLWMFSDGSKEV